MGVVAIIKNFSRRVVNGITIGEAQIKPDGISTLTAQHFQPAGDDAQPLDGDYAIGVPTQRTGVVAAAGYVDSQNAPVSAPGEKRIYARDPDTGAIVCSMWLKNDGTVDIQADGNITINGVTISSSGEVEIPSSLVLASKELAGHIHGGVESGSSNTSPNI